MKSIYIANVEIQSRNENIGIYQYSKNIVFVFLSIREKIVKGEVNMNKELKTLQCIINNLIQLTPDKQEKISNWVSEYVGISEELNTIIKNRISHTTVSERVLKRNILLELGKYYLERYNLPSEKITIDEASLLHLAEKLKYVIMQRMFSKEEVIQILKDIDIQLDESFFPYSVEELELEIKSNNARRKRYKVENNIIYIERKVNQNESCE